MPTQFEMLGEVWEDADGVQRTITDARWWEHMGEPAIWVRFGNYGEHVYPPDGWVKAEKRPDAPAPLRLGK